MWYVGSRTAKNCNPEDGYICSSKIVKPLIKANPSEWVKTIIATGTAKEMLELEFQILDVTNAIMDQRSYNMANGKLSGIVGKFKSNQHKKNLRLVNIGKKHTPESRTKMKNAWIGKIKKSGYKWKQESRNNVAGIPKSRCSCIGCGKELSVPGFYRWHAKCLSLIHI